MSGETEKDVSGWTVDTVRSHFEGELTILRELLLERYQTQTKALEAAFDAQRTAMEAALASAEKAVEKAEVASEKRFDSVNEFRAQLTDQARSFMTRVESQSQHEALNEKIEGIANVSGNRLGRIEVALNGVTTQETTLALERVVNTMSPRREAETAHEALSDKIADAIEMMEKRAGVLQDAAVANALAIEKVNAAGQTIYVLRAEAAGQAKNTDDKIMASTATAAAQNKIVADAVTELRASLNEQATVFMPRGESETRTTANTERLREIEIRMQTYPTRDETAVALNAADAKFAAGIGTVTEKTNNIADRMAALDLRLSSRLDLSTGKGAGMNALFGWAVAGIGLIVTVIVAANALLR